MQTWDWWSLPCFAFYLLLVLCLMLSWLLLSCSFWSLSFAAIWSKAWSMRIMKYQRQPEGLFWLRHPSRPCLVQSTVLNCIVFYCMILEVMRLLNIFNIIFKYWWSNEKIVKHQSLHGLYKIKRRSFIFFCKYMFFCDGFTIWKKIEGMKKRNTLFTMQTLLTVFFLFSSFSWITSFITQPLQEARKTPIRIAYAPWLTNSSKNVTASCIFSNKDQNCYMTPVPKFTLIQRILKLKGKP